MQRVGMDAALSGAAGIVRVGKVMKAYVIGYRRRPEDEGVIEVMYGPDPEPESTYASSQIAKAACKKLNSFGVRVGMHQCAFSVDPLRDGDFGIFCVCHPHYFAARSSVFPLRVVVKP